MTKITIEGLDLVDDTDPFDYGLTYTYQDLVKAIEMASTHTKDQIINEINKTKQ